MPSSAESAIHSLIRICCGSIITRQSLSSARHFSKADHPPLGRPTLLTLLRRKSCSMSTLLSLMLMAPAARNDRSWTVWGVAKKSLRRRVGAERPATSNLQTVSNCRLSSSGHFCAKVVIMEMCAFVPNVLMTVDSPFSRQFKPSVFHCIQKYTPKH